jgi:hypothetical protein
METDPVERPESKRAAWSQVSHRVEYFWLCDRCAVALTLFYEKGRGIVTVARSNAVRKPPVSAACGADFAQSKDDRSGQSA